MKLLIIQTAFIGDVILATPLIEQLRRIFPDATIDFALRKGNESLLQGHPHLRKVYIWRKKEEKYRGLWRLMREIRRERYDWVINCQRFAASGVLTVLSGARHTVGFDKNPLSLFFSRRVTHRFGTAAQPIHEVERNLSLIAHLTPETPTTKPEIRPRLYPAAADYAKARQLGAGYSTYVCIAPTSVWFTKQYPAHKWIELLRLFPAETAVFLLGGPGDLPACEAICAALPGHKVLNLAGRLSFLESAALMENAAMNYVNDSAPMHMASAVNAPTTAVFCSTIPAFGFTPLAQNALVVETGEALDCRPCGLHGYKSCPKGHFRCAETIDPVVFKIP
ncbi:MAG: glycosyltransferase family 9 protein [Saprospiraceae bacterium]|nr:glycosyltransferase family 9 protein [Saprospiraceae bacterium]